MNKTLFYNIFQKKQFICFFLLLPTFVFSQHKIEGFVKDNNSNSIDGANIILKKIDNEETVTYTTSNNKGAFDLETKTGNYILKISYIGYKTILQNIEVKNTDVQLNTITLIENSTELEEVILKAENSGIIQKGDVTQYKIDKFLNGTEENLKDIISKLPGLGINENGKITANGKEIDRLLIDGENLYKKQHQLATENINSEMVKDAELIRNYKDFESINQNDKTGITALNINIKDEFKNKFTGNIEAHTGIKDKYKVKASLFNFNKKIKLSLLPNTNNLGESTMSIKDYYALTDTETRNNSKGESKVTFSKLDDLPRFLNSNNRVESIKNNFVALSSIANLSKKIKIDFYGIFNNSKQNELNKRELNYSLNQIQVSEKNAIKEINYFGIVQLNTTYKPTKNEVFSLKNHINIDNTDQEKEILSTSNNITNNLEEKNKPKKLIFNSELAYSKNINSNILNTSITFKYLKGKHNNYISSNNPFLNLDFNGNNFTTKQTINKTIRQTDYNVDFALNYNKFSVNFNNNTSIASNQLSTSTNNLNTFGNDLSLNQFSTKNGIDFTFKLSNKISFNAGTDYNYTSNNLNNNKSKVNYLGFNTSLKSIFSSNNIAQFSYKYSNSIPTLDYLTNGFIIKDYRNIIQNENVLINNLYPYHQINISHFVFKPKSKFSYIFNASYNIKEESIGNNIINQEDITISKNKNINKDRFFNAFAFFDKRFKKAPFSFSGSLSYNNTNKEYYQDNILANFKNDNISSIIKIKSHFKKSFIHINLGYKYSKDIFRDDTNTSKLVISQPYLNINGKISKNLFWNLNSNVSLYKGLNTTRTIYNIGPRLRFSKEKSKWNFYLTGDNIFNLNNKTIIENNSSPSYSEQKTTSILDGYIVFGSKLKF